LEVDQPCDQGLADGSGLIFQLKCVAQAGNFLWLCLVLQSSGQDRAEQWFLDKLLRLRIIAQPLPECNFHKKAPRRALSG